MTRHLRMRRSAGFTLIEVVVALAIVAIALTAGLQVTSTLTRDSERQTERILSEICAVNTIHRVRLSASLADVGTTETACDLAGQTFMVRSMVQASGNVSFRRVRVEIYNQRSEPVLQVVALKVGQS